MTSRQNRRLPVVLSRTEIDLIIKNIPATYKLLTQVIYGGGLRLTECIKLRIKDIDFDNGILTIRSGKGDKDRETLLSNSTYEHLKKQISSARELYDKDRKENKPGVELPKALERKYPNAGKEFA